MENDNEWEIVYNEQYQRDNSFSPVTIYPALSRHTVEFLAAASPIPATWRSAGRLYCFLQDPNSSSFPRATLIENVPINVSSELFWLQYHPHRWFLEQTIRIRSYHFG